MEDLSLIHDDSRPDIPTSIQKKKKKLSESYTKYQSPKADSKIVTPVKALISIHSKSQKSAKGNSKKDKSSLDIEGGEHSIKNVQEDMLSGRNFTSNFGFPGTFSSDATKKLIASVSSAGSIYCFS